MAHSRQQLGAQKTKAKNTELSQYAKARKEFILIFGPNFLAAASQYF